MISTVCCPLTGRAVGASAETVPSGNGNVRGRYVTAITAVGDSKAGLERLRAALLAIDKEGFPSGKMELQGREGAGSDCVYAIEQRPGAPSGRPLMEKLREYLSGKAQGKYPGNLSISIRRVSL